MPDTSNPTDPVAVAQLGTAAAVSDRRQRRRHKRKRQYTAWHDRRSGQPLATVLLGGLILGAPQLLGGVLPWTSLVIAGLSLVCLAVVGARAPAAQRSWPRLGLMLVLLTVWTWVQVLPMACGLVAALAPSSAASADAVRTLLGDRASACSLTQEPGNTRLEVIKTCAVAATFLACWAFAASGGRRRLLWLIAGSTLLMSLVAIAHGLLELDRVFGVYLPTGIERSWLLAPLMNPNNLGGFAALGVPLWVGLSYRHADFNVRLLGYAAFGVNTSAAILSLSRGAIAQVVASIAVTGFLIYRQRQQKRHPPRGAVLRDLGLALGGAAGLGVGAYLVGRDVLGDFTHGNFSKLELSVQALRFAWQHALTGVGRGAFASAFVSFHSPLVRFRYAEDFVAQWAADWGLPFTVATLLVIAYELAIGFRRKPASLTQQTAYLALLAWCAQNLVDFSFELSGPAVVASALLAACVAPSSDPKRLERPEPRIWLQARALIAGLLVIGLLSFVLLAPRVQAETVPALQARLSSALAQQNRPQFRQQLRAALYAHPAEPVLVLLAATESLTHRDPKTFAWLNRAMQLAPGWALPHQLAFRWLWQRGLGRQALLELKTAASIDSHAAEADACRLGKVDADWVLAVVPDNHLRRDFFGQVGNCMAVAETSEAFDRAFLREYPEETSALIRSVHRLLREGEPDAALAIVERLRQRYPARPDILALTIATFYTTRRDQDLFDEVDRDLPRLDLPGQIDALGKKAMVLGRLDNHEGVQEMLSEIRRRSSTNAGYLASSYELEGNIHFAHGELGKSLVAYREAYRISEDTRYLLNIGGLAERLGDRPQALWAYINLCQREPLGSGCERRNALLSVRRPNSTP